MIIHFLNNKILFYVNLYLFLILKNISIKKSFLLFRIMVILVNMILMVVHSHHLGVHILTIGQENKIKRKDVKFD